MNYVILIGNKKFSIIKMNRNTLRNILIAIILFSGISVGIKKFNFMDFESPENIRSTAQLNQNVVSSRMTYGRFLEYLEMGWVKQVDHKQLE
jgi:hypothetical protein